LTIGEIRRGVESVRRRDPDSATALDSWLSRLTERQFWPLQPKDRRRRAVDRARAIA